MVDMTNTRIAAEAFICGRRDPNCSNERLYEQISDKLGFILTKLQKKLALNMFEEGSNMSKLLKK